MPEVTHTRKHHRESELIGGGDHFIIAHRSARLCDRRRASFSRQRRPVGKWEQGLRYQHRSFERYAQPRRLLASRVQGIDSRGCATTYGQRPVLSHEYNRVRFDVLAHPMPNPSACISASVGVRLVTTLP